MALRPDDEDPVVTRARYMLDTPEGAAGAIALIEGFLARQPKAVEARFLYARLLASQGRAQDARTQMELALKQEPDSPPILFSLAQIAYQTQNASSALTTGLARPKSQFPNPFIAQPASRPTATIRL